LNTQEKYIDLLQDYKNALKNFGNSLQIITLQFDETVVDTIKSGRIQKFEKTTELAWKCGKLFIELNFGENILTPKSVYKKLFLLELIDENLYLQLMKTVDDRNMLSHVYKEKMFVSIHKNLDIHCQSLQQLFNKLNAA
jgi:nucleotidyltransferase substrate binding protein (TIGR01987 family)